MPNDTPDHRAASAHLAALDADWARLVAQVGPCTLAPERAREPYEALVRAVAYQQLHARAAAAILGRLLALYPDTPFPTPAQLLATEVERLRACGLSARKVETLQGIARATLSGQVPSRAAAEGMDDAALIERLISLRGIGRWTVEMLLIFCLGRPDVLPADDFGVRNGYRRLKGLEQLPTPRELARAGLACRPWRSIAAWYLWRVPAQ
ncbi:MAG TPA: DNA-3-methyladenine glycosylase [Pseudomonas sp.]|nr:DNA-3-methyladenine glycosylase [Pseudomonas sp.]